MNWLLEDFVTGTTTSANHFQAFLLEGVMRWNQDRESVAKTGAVKPGTYDRFLKHASNKLHKELWGKPLDENYQDPKKFSGK